MEFRFDLNDIFKDDIVEVDSTLIPPGFKGDKRMLWDTQAKVSQIVNAIGEASARAQGLNKAITTSDRLRNSEHKLYLLIDKNASNGKGAVTGMLKIGEKGLYVFDRQGQHYKVSPCCVLDFYVHESRQRSGYGKKLFEHMLKKEQTEPVKMAIDRPSDKFLGFLNKHYSLDAPIKQMNNYVVFDGFFPKNAEDSTRQPRAKEAEPDQCIIPSGKKQSANGLQAFPSSPYGRYGAPRPPCSMGQIIHNDTAVVRNQEPTGVHSAPATNEPKQAYFQHSSQEQFVQSTPNIHPTNIPQSYPQNTVPPPQDVTSEPPLQCAPPQEHSNPQNQTYQDFKPLDSTEQTNSNAHAQNQNQGHSSQIQNFNIQGQSSQVQGDYSRQDSQGHDSQVQGHYSQIQSGRSQIYGYHSQNTDTIRQNNYESPQGHHSQDHDSQIQGRPSQIQSHLSQDRESVKQSYYQSPKYVDQGQPMIQGYQNQQGDRGQNIQYPYGYMQQQPQNQAVYDNQIQKPHYDMNVQQQPINVQGHRVQTQPVCYQEPLLPQKIDTADRNQIQTSQSSPIQGYVVQSQPHTTPSVPNYGQNQNVPSSPQNPSNQVIYDQNSTNIQNQGQNIQYQGDPGPSYQLHNPAQPTPSNQHQNVQYQQNQGQNFQYQGQSSLNQHPAQPIASNQHQNVQYQQNQGQNIQYQGQSSLNQHPAQPISSNQHQNVQYQPNQDQKVQHQGSFEQTTQNSSNNVHSPQSRIQLQPGVYYQPAPSNQAVINATVPQQNVMEPLQSQKVPEQRKPNVEGFQRAQNAGDAPQNFALNGMQSVSNMKNRQEPSKSVPNVPNSLGTRQNDIRCASVFPIQGGGPQTVAGHGGQKSVLSMPSGGAQRASRVTSGLDVNQKTKNATRMMRMNEIQPCDTQNRTRIISQ